MLKEFDGYVIETAGQSPDGSCRRSGRTRKWSFSFQCSCLNRRGQWLPAIAAEFWKYGECCSAAAAI